MTAAAILRALFATLMILAGATVAIVGGHMSAPFITVGGVAVIVLGARLLRPCSPGVLQWLDRKEA